MAEEYKYLVRIANTDLDGGKSICMALTKIRGVGFMFSNMVCNLAGIDKNKKTGVLSDTEVETINNILKEPIKFGAPEWMLNRRRDIITGETKHLITTDIKFVLDNDVRRLQKIRCYRGFRHAFGLPVRGQRTKSNFRKNKGNVLGVQRKKVAPASESKDTKSDKKGK